MRRLLAALALLALVALALAFLVWGQVAKAQYATTPRTPYRPIKPGAVASFPLTGTGGRFRDAGQNFLASSEDLTTADWTLVGGAGRTVNTVTSTNPATDYVQAQLPGPIMGPFTLSLWVGGTGTVGVQCGPAVTDVPVGYSCEYANATATTCSPTVVQNQIWVNVPQSSLAGDSVRLRMTFTCSGATAGAPYIRLAGGWRFVSPVPSLAGTGTFSRVVVEHGNGDGPYQQTTGSYVIGPFTHVNWNGAALDDSRARPWTMTGTVPQVAAGALPVTSAPGAAGPFSDSNYYVWNLAGLVGTDGAPDDRYGCVTYVPFGLTNNPILHRNLQSTYGHRVQVQSTGAFTFDSYSGGPPGTLVSATTANTGVLRGVNVGCWWRTGNTIYSKLNLGTTANAAAGATETVGVGAESILGRGDLNTETGFAFNGYLIDFTEGRGACPGVSCEAWATLQQQQVFGLLGTRDEVIALTRTTNKTVERGGLVWNVPANAFATRAEGSAIERLAANFARQSSTMSSGSTPTAPWTLTSATVTTNTADAPDGSNSTRLTSSANIGWLAQSVTGAPTSTRFSGSAWVRAASGSGVAASVLGVCGAGNATIRSCRASDGSATTAYTLASTYACRASVSSTAWVRIMVDATCSTTSTTHTIRLKDGDFSLGTFGTVVDFAMAQLEQNATTGAVVSSYIPTLGTAVVRNDDQVIPPWPLPVTVATGWCWTRRYTPYLNRPANLTSGGTAGLYTAVSDDLWDVSSVAGNHNFNVTDTTLALRTWSTPEFTDGYRHTVQQYYLAAGPDHRIRMDGTMRVPTVAGAGTGSLTNLPSFHYLGAYGSTDYVEGWFENYQIHRGYCP